MWLQMRDYFAWIFPDRSVGTDQVTVSVGQHSILGLQRKEDGTTTQERLHVSPPHEVIGETTTDLM